jgi:hypothetical protein
MRWTMTEAGQATTNNKRVGSASHPRHPRAWPGDKSPHGPGWIPGSSPIGAKIARRAGSRLPSLVMVRLERTVGANTPGESDFGHTDGPVEPDHDDQ